MPELVLNIDLTKIAPTALNDFDQMEFVSPTALLREGGLKKAGPYSGREIFTAICTALGNRAQELAEVRKRKAQADQLQLQIDELIQRAGRCLEEELAPLRQQLAAVESIPAN